METRVHTYYGDVTADACHGTPPSQFSTVQHNYGINHVYDSNQTRTKREAIEEVNQTVKTVFDSLC